MSQNRKFIPHLQISLKMLRHKLSNDTWNSILRFTSPDHPIYGNSYVIEDFEIELEKGFKYYEKKNANVHLIKKYFQIGCREFIKDMLFYKILYHIILELKGNPKFGTAEYESFRQIEKNYYKLDIAYHEEGFNSFHLFGGTFWFFGKIERHLIIRDSIEERILFLRDYIINLEPYVQSEKGIDVDGKPSRQIAYTTLQEQCKSRLIELRDQQTKQQDNFDHSLKEKFTPLQYVIYHRFKEIVELAPKFHEKKNGHFPKSEIIKFVKKEYENCNPSSFFSQYKEILVEETLYNQLKIHKDKVLHLVKDDKKTLEYIKNILKTMK